MGRDKLSILTEAFGNVKTFALGVGSIQPIFHDSLVDFHVQLKIGLLFTLFVIEILSTVILLTQRFYVKKNRTHKRVNCGWSVLHILAVILSFSAFLPNRSVSPRRET